MTDDLTRLTAAQLSAGLRAGEYSSADVTHAHLDRIQQTDTALGSFITVTPEQALSTATDVDRRRAAAEAAAPPDDPPGTVVVSHGLRVGPNAECSVVDPIANSSMFVLPSTGRPAALILLLIVAS